jgi:hypothetical protein
MHQRYQVRLAPTLHTGLCKHICHDNLDRYIASKYSISYVVPTLCIYKSLGKNFGHDKLITYFKIQFLCVCIGQGVES